MTSRKKYKECRGCKGTFKGVELSHASLCVQCAEERVRTANRQMKDKKGLIYRRWLKGVKDRKLLQENAARHADND